MNLNNNQESIEYKIQQIQKDIERFKRFLSGTEYDNFTLLTIVSDHEIELEESESIEERLKIYMSMHEKIDCVLNEYLQMRTYDDKLW